MASILSAKKIKIKEMETGDCPRFSLRTIKKFRYTTRPLLIFRSPYPFWNLEHGIWRLFLIKLKIVFDIYLTYAKMGIN
jgi:hypothetical protein